MISQRSGNWVLRQRCQVRPSVVSSLSLQARASDEQRAEKAKATRGVLADAKALFDVPNDK
jgi:hypothetical protein